MPDVHISWLAGRTVDQKRKVVEGITKVLMEEAGCQARIDSHRVRGYSAHRFCVGRNARCG